MSDELREGELELLVRHWPRWSPQYRAWVCGACGFEQPWPCPTTAALFSLIEARRELAAVAADLADVTALTATIAVDRDGQRARAETAEGERTRLRKLIDRYHAQHDDTMKRICDNESWRKCSCGLCREAREVTG